MTGKRYSRQRELIYQRLMDTDKHPTAEMIYNWIKPEHPTLSLGTVYRNLNLLADEGIIMRMPFPVERYDANTEPHSHFQCKKCGGVYDLECVEYNGKLDETVSLQSGHLVEHHDLVFFGTCLNCTQKR